MHSRIQHFLFISIRTCKFKGPFSDCRFQSGFMIQAIKEAAAPSHREAQGFQSFHSSVQHSHFRACSMISVCHRSPGSDDCCEAAPKPVARVNDFVANFRYGSVPASSQPAVSLNASCVASTTSHGLFSCVTESAARFGVDCALM